MRSSFFHLIQCVSLAFNADCLWRINSLCSADAPVADASVYVERDSCGKLGPVLAAGCAYKIMKIVEGREILEEFSCEEDY